MLVCIKPCHSSRQERGIPHFFLCIPLFVFYFSLLVSDISSRLHRKSYLRCTIRVAFRVRYKMATSLALVHYLHRTLCCSQRELKCVEGVVLTPELWLHRSPRKLAVVVVLRQTRRRRRKQPRSNVSLFVTIVAASSWESDGFICATRAIPLVMIACPRTNGFGVPKDRRLTACCGYGNVF